MTNSLFSRILAGLAIGWAAAAVLCWAFPAPFPRALLASIAGCLLLLAFGWYCSARWSGRLDGARTYKPIALCIGAWSLCLGTALTSAFARRAESGVPAPQAEMPRSKLFPDGPRRFLCDLEEFDVVNGKWPFTKGETGDGHVIKVGGRKSPHGLGMHPPWAPKFASVKYKLGMEAALFKATVAIDDSTNWCW